MYIILLDESNALTVTTKECIMQRSKLVDKLCFLVDPIYKGHDMTNSTVLLEYVLPVSRKYCTEVLTLSDTTYKGYLRYELPFDTKLTTEAGKIELQLSFLSVSLVNDKITEQVRKTKATSIEITPISPWSDYIPDSALTAVDQRIIKQDAQIKAMEELINQFDITKADNLTFNPEDKSLQLLAGETSIGDKVKLEELMGDDHLEDGIPVVDFGSGEFIPPVDEDSDVVEF